MTISLASLLGILYALSELCLAFKKRANGSETRIADRGSLNLLWIVIVASVALAFMLAPALPAANIVPAPAARDAGIALFFLGLAIRWYAIILLGRFFTVNVAIAADHRLIESGPYRFVRHPSYTGALMAFVGLGLCLGNWASLLLMMAPILLAFLRRMAVEEAALLRAFPEQYPGYMGRTKRLVPAVY